MTIIPLEVEELIKLSGDKSLPPREYLRIAHHLNVALVDIERAWRKQQQLIEQMTLKIYQAQEKKNLGAAEMEIRGSDEYRLCRELEDTVDHIKRSIGIARKSGDIL